MATIVIKASGIVRAAAYMAKMAGVALVGRIPRDLHEDRPRCRTAEDEDKGIRQIAGREKASRDAVRPSEDPPWLRANAASGPLRRSRRVPPRRYRAEVENYGAPDTRAATATGACVGRVGVVLVSTPTPLPTTRRRPSKAQPSLSPPQAASSGRRSDRALFRQHRSN